MWMMKGVEHRCLNITWSQHFGVPNIHGVTLSGRSYVDILNAYLERNLRSNGGVLDGVIFAMVKYTMEASKSPKSRQTW